MMDALVVDAIGAAVLAGSAAAGAAVRARTDRSRGRRRSVPTARLIRSLPGRSRRLARAIVVLADECRSQHPAGSNEAFTAEETLRSYLPDTIGAYLAVPPSVRAAARRGDGGARDELEHQLQTLYAALCEIREADTTRAYAAMSANRAFLNERFGAVAGPQRRLHDDPTVDALARYALAGARSALRLVEAAIERARGGSRTSNRR